MTDDILNTFDRRRSSEMLRSSARLRKPRIASAEQVRPMNDMIYCILEAVRRQITDFDGTGDSAFSLPDSEFSHLMQLKMLGGNTEVYTTEVSDAEANNNLLEMNGSNAVFNLDHEVIDSKMSKESSGSGSSTLDSESK